MQGSEQFKKVIEDYLIKRSISDPLFTPSFLKQNKNIDDCIKYILNTVQKQKVNGLSDAEVFGLAVHYYDEDEIDIGGDINCRVLVNHKVELTQEEIEEEKQRAKEEVFNQHKNYLSKPKKKSVIKPITQPTLF
jgi:hypothetical protein